MPIPFECLIEAKRRHAIEACQICIQNHALVTNHQNQGFQLLLRVQFLLGSHQVAPTEY
jgi:hypothetical protein